MIEQIALHLDKIPVDFLYEADVKTSDTSEISLPQYLSPVHNSCERNAKLILTSQGCFRSECFTHELSTS